MKEKVSLRRVVLDVTHTPDDESVDGFGFDLDMTLFKNIDGFDTSILDTPMGATQILRDLLLTRSH